MSEQVAGYIIDRDSFRWSTDSLISLAREAITQTIEGLSRENPSRNIVNELDIVMQSMLSLCHYRPEDVWEGNKEVINRTSNHITTDFLGTIGAEFRQHVENRDVKPNLDLIVPVVQTHYERQEITCERLQNSNAEFVRFIRGDIDAFGCPDPTTTTKAREFHREQDGTTSMHVREKHTGKRIIMKPVDLRTSQQYAEELHYVHKAREDEVAAFGAYLEDHEFPFAWVSYSPIGTDAERTIASHAGGAPDRTLEMTRAWNTWWSPKNTMSVLFSYAHNQLQTMSKAQTVAGVQEDLSAIITAINPNLGFSGMAFSGVDFGVVGLKPTNHKFLMEDCIPIYMLRRDIAKHLGIAVTSLAQNARYSESSMPLLHTNVMMVMFEKSARRKPDSSIYVVNPNTYNGR